MSVVPIASADAVAMKSGLYNAISGSNYESYLSPRAFVESKIDNIF